ncbi:MAG: DUF3592 domain-containing protein [Clostridium baratii]|uniref:DUF3592 domain-containing protein n=1 Tax=Clostridium baratii str. Sullivan TaxID=1415775 RepID=A0A0A7FV65_9CLOT|nr:DUF3592 domain-containing protein [Clostridium baratii]AIY83478.1 hypothetical protein U729_2524 [Clostridium baratii str. Sullivan]MBS6006254.1 DUF3592 domain-containing protein [Clostridium baratii]MDU1055075.1 DUF3592 domain-containing protein [Clostridium baratii]MDU4911145.1 DUF3592 domain-containing protein [Clostridium baratii]CUP08320.1 Protein of uncharacterised function (DUF3592) [Clostridium baratii]
MEGYILLAIGIALILIAIVTFFIKNNVYKKGIRVKGTVLELKKSDEAILDDFNQVTFLTLYKQVIEFTTKENEKIVFLHDSGSKYNNLKVGDEITIIYNEKNSDEFYVDDKVEVFRLPITLVITAILFLVFSFTLFLM